MNPPSYLELESDVSKLVYALATCNSGVCEALITSLRDRLSLETVAGMMLISLEQLLRLNSQAFVWAVESWLPVDVFQEIRRISTVTIGKQLIERGLQPGQDFSVNFGGQLLLNEAAKTAMFG